MVIKAKDSWRHEPKRGILMKLTIITYFLLFSSLIFGQNIQFENLGFRHLQMLYKNDTVDILVKSKKGEENKQKPLFLFCQGSGSTPLIVKEGNEYYGTFPFTTDTLLDKFHIAIISKPFISLMIERKNLNSNYFYLEKNNLVPKKYAQRNYLSYYVERNIAAIEFLGKQKYISNKKLIIAGHSEGATIASKLASKYQKITHLIYSGGNPFGRIMTMIGQFRKIESDSLPYAESRFSLWNSVLKDTNSLDFSNGDSNKNLYGFSKPPIEYLQKLKIPVFVTYGSLDWCAPFNDYFRIKTITENKINFTFKDYVGTEHNYFPLRENGETNFENYNWNKVVYDWVNWIDHN